MDLRTQCTQLKVKLEPIALETGYSLPYVGMVVRGKRNNPKIISAVYIALEKRKKELRKLIL